MVKRLPYWGKLAYGVGAGGYGLIDRIMVTWLMYFYVLEPIRGQVALISGFAFGVVMFLGRVVDAIADPLFARWSDNHRGRLGRRIPFMLYSGVLYVAVFIALFYPPVAGESPVNQVYLALMLGLTSPHSRRMSVLTWLCFPSSRVPPRTASIWPHGKRFSASWASPVQP